MSHVFKMACKHQPFNCHPHSKDIHEYVDWFILSVYLHDVNNVSTSLCCECYVCVCVCVCGLVCTCVHVCVKVQLCVWFVWLCMRVCRCAHMYMCVCVCVGVQVTLH